MKSILITNMYSGIGGGELAILEHVRYLKVHGVSVYVVLLEHGEFEQRLIDAGVDLVQVLPFAWGGGKKQAILNMLSISNKIFRLIKRYEIEIVMSYTLNDLIFSGFASKVARVPLMYRSQADVIGVDKDINLTWMGKAFFTIFRFLSPYIAATTKGEVDRLLQLNYDKKKMSVVYLGVDSNRFYSSMKRSQVLLKDLNVSNGEFVISIFGRLTEWKGQLEYLFAFAQIVKMGYPVKGWIVGDDSFGGGGGYRDKLSDEIHNLGLDDKVFLLGMRNDVADLMRSSDIIIHASYEEPFGLVIIEAMMSGVPVIASDVSGPRESVVAGVTGLLAAPKDIDGLVKQMEKMLDDVELRKSMAKAAIERSHELFDKDQNLAKLTIICDKLIKN